MEEKCPKCGAPLAEPTETKTGRPIQKWGGGFGRGFINPLSSQYNAFLLP